MCRECLVAVRPERGRTCLETGAFVMNYAGCDACKQRSSIAAVGREVSEDEQDNGDYEETVTFHHACSVCGHAIAEHYYTFTVVHPPHSPGSVQHEYLMDCVLCGRAADTSHAINDVVCHTARQQQQYTIAAAHAHAAHSLPAVTPQRQQQPGMVGQLIGRMEIVSVALHAASTSAAGNKRVDVEEDEWT